MTNLSKRAARCHGERRVRVTCRDFPNYEIDEQGRVYRRTPANSTFVGRELKPHVVKQLNLVVDGQRKVVSVGRLMRVAFGEPSVKR
jgi:hypothetical protein